MKQFLLVPAWSNQAVSPFMRFLALAFVACALLALIGAGVNFANTGHLPDMESRSPFDFLMYAYLLVLFTYVAVKGKAPSTWIPWK